MSVRASLISLRFSTRLLPDSEEHSTKLRMRDLSRGSLPSLDGRRNVQMQ